jgi:hypothetical protein
MAKQKSEEQPSVFDRAILTEIAEMLKEIRQRTRATISAPWSTFWS